MFEGGWHLMALDGVMMSRIINLMNADAPLKINRITQPSNHEFLIQCFAGKKKNLYISTHPVFARIQWTQHKPSTNLDQTHLLVLMRKYLEGGIITSIEQYGTDRVVTIHVEHRDDMGVIRPYRLIVELLGKYANVIIVDDAGAIIDALKRISPFENDQRAIVPGGIYDYPPQFEKQSIKALANYDSEDALLNQYSGISPLLEKELLYRMKTEAVSEILEELETSNTLYVYPKDFHIIQLKHLNIPYEEHSIMEGLDAYFYDMQLNDRIKQHTGDLLKILKREVKRAKQKLPKLEHDYENASDSEMLRTYGDLLFAFANALPSGNNAVEVSDFEGNPITIPLDPRFGGKDNARRYFKRYQKAKTSLKYLEDQILQTESRIEYLEALILQTEQAGVEDAAEIQEELISQGIIHAKRFKQKNGHSNKKKRKPNVSVIKYDDDTTIYVGKNNIQNDYVTFKLGRKDDMWFHAAYNFGAHVLIQTPELNEDKIRLCAHLSAYFSKSRYGSSVEVHYTQIRNIKKIPGGQMGLVSMSTHKSIYIDPDKSIIERYLPEAR